MALVAGMLGVLAVGMIWRQRRNGVDVARSRHPSAPSPIAFTLDVGGGDGHWRVTNRHGILNVTVDIVTFRVSGSGKPWVSEPIVDPILLEPGASSVLPSVVDGSEESYDVVVAWTVRHLDGETTGSRVLTVDPTQKIVAAPVAPPMVEPLRGFAVVYGLLAALLVLVVLVAGWRLFDGGRDDSPVAAQPTLPLRPPPTTEAVASTTTVPTSRPSTTAVEPAVAPTTVPPTSAPATTTPATATSAPVTTSPVTTTTTTTTTTTVPARVPETTSAVTSATTTSGGGETRQVLISGRVEDCRFGAECLVASFTLDGFASTGEYVCEFDDGSRFIFRYIGDGADDACSTSGSSPSITIEVDGVRSATITRESVGTG